MMRVGNKNLNTFTCIRLQIEECCLEEGHCPSDNSHQKYKIGLHRTECDFGQIETNHQIQHFAQLYTYRISYGWHDLLAKSSYGLTCSTTLKWSTILSNLVTCFQTWESWTIVHQFGISKDWKEEKRIWQNTLSKSCKINAIKAYDRSIKE